MHEQDDFRYLKSLFRNIPNWRLADLHHDLALREAEACFKEIALKPSERTKLLCDCAAKIFDHCARGRVELLKKERDLGRLERELIDFRWDWTAPLKAANLDEAETASIETTLRDRRLYWQQQAIDKTMGGAGNWVGPEPVKAQGDSEGIAAPAQTAGSESNLKSDASKAKERQEYIARHIAPTPGRPTMNALAEKLEIQQSSFSRWYTGKKPFGKANLGKLAGYLGVEWQKIPN